MSPQNWRNRINQQIVLQGNSFRAFCASSISIQMEPACW